MTDIATDAAKAPPPKQAPTKLVSLVAAAELLRKDYREPDKLDTLATLEIGGVTARIVQPEGREYQPVLLIRGTDQVEDFKLWNLLIRPMLEVGKGETRRWARGFLRHSDRAYSFAKGWLEAGGKLGAVYGHSLGGAAVQIICPALRLIGVSFGSPAPLFDAREPVGAEFVTNHVLEDDLVTKVPVFWPRPPWRFAFVGKVVRHEKREFAPASRRMSDKHSIERYKAAAEAARWDKP